MQHVFSKGLQKFIHTGKSFSEALILASVVFCFCFDIQNNICTQHVLNLYFSGNSINNLSSYCGLTDSRMRASDTDLPVCTVRPTEVVPRRGLQILSIEYVIERV